MLLRHASASNSAGGIVLLAALTSSRVGAAMNHDASRRLTPRGAWLGLGLGLGSGFGFGFGLGLGLGIPLAKEKAFRGAKFATTPQAPSS